MLQQHIQNKHTCTHARTRTRRTRTNAHACACVCALHRTCTHVRTHAPHARTRTRTHAFTYVRTRARTHTHTQAHQRARIVQARASYKMVVRAWSGPARPARPSRSPGAQMQRKGLREGDRNDAIRLGRGSQDSDGEAAAGPAERGGAAESLYPAGHGPAAFNR
jgi:hypothetical protein